jgi:DNA-directed RNA polymerase specialized sigma24 family protein
MPQLNPSTPKPAPVPRPEDVLAQRYEQLCAWATGLTRGDVGVALDLVHDLYVYITLAKPDLSRAENLDNYLYKCLRHIHLAHLMESSRNALQHVSIADIDSLEFAVWTNGELYLLEQQNDLRRICRYAIWRKDQSKSASFFALRFFHGYHVAEIAEMAGLAQSVIQPKMSRMRLEMRQYLENPKATQFSGAPEEESQWTAISSIKLFRELRTSILEARKGDCLEEDQLLAQYRLLVPKPISCSLLSHVVSCEHCLSVLDRHFGRPTLGDREPVDGTVGPVKGKFAKAGAAMQQLDHKEMLALALKHRRDVYEHRPQYLSIAVDGKIVASHRVQGQENTQLARIERPEQIGCIEIFSEQDVRLAFVLVEDLPPNGPSQRCEHIELSEGRWIEVRLHFDSLGLDAAVTYFDPMPFAEEADDELEAGSFRLVSTVSPRSDAGNEETGIVVAPPKGLEGTRSREPLRIGFMTAGWAAWWSRFASRIKEMSLPDVNLLFAGAVVLGIASIVCFLSWLHMSRKPAVTAIALLDNAARWEAGVPEHGQPGVIYQKVKITARERTLERAIYRDAEGRRKPRRAQLGPEDEQLRSKLNAVGIAWDAPLSAAGYRSWRGRQGMEHDQVTRVGDNLLKLTTTVDAPGAAVVGETLTVRRSDFHPVDRTVELRGFGTVEIAELNYDVLPWNMANPDWFEPLAGDVALPRGVHSSLSPHLPYIPSVVELDEAELEAWLVLNQLHADQGEQIVVGRNTRAIVVRGLVKTEERKRQIEIGLESVRLVTPVVFTFDEMASKQALSGEETTSLKTAADVRQPSPLEKYLVPLGRPRDAVSDLARGLVEDAVTANRGSNETVEILRQFSVGRDLTPRAQEVLADLVASHKRDLLAALDREDQLLREAGFTPADAAASASGPLVELSSRMGENLKLCREMASTSAEEGRPAQDIALEIFVEIASLRSMASSIAIAPNSTNATAQRSSNGKDQ